MTDKEIQEAAQKYAADTQEQLSYYAVADDAFIAGANFALAHLWRNPKVELPEENETCLIIVGQDKITATFHEKTADGESTPYFITADNDLLGDLEVTVWLPIPEYKES